MKAFIVLFVAALLAACTPKERIVTKTEYVLITPELLYLSLTKVPKPTPMAPIGENELPDFEALYVNAGLDIIELYSALGQCNNDKLAITKDIEKKRGLYGR